MMAKKEKNDLETQNIDNKEELESAKSCFIITPIGEINSDVYLKAMGLIDSVISPVLEENNFKAIAANNIDDLGSINRQIVLRILRDKVVIANLTGLNPNVMYELAIRHAARKPVIIMAEYGTKLPFDINDQRTIFYSDSLAGVEKAKKELRSKLISAIGDEKPDNPIYNVIGDEILIKKLENEEPGAPWELILNRLDKLETSINSSSSSRYSLNLRRTGGTGGSLISVKFIESINDNKAANILYTINDKYNTSAQLEYLSENEMKIRVSTKDNNELDNISDFLTALPGVRQTTISKSIN